MLSKEEVRAVCELDASALDVAECRRYVVSLVEVMCNIDAQLAEYKDRKEAGEASFDVRWRGKALRAKAGIQAAVTRLKERIRQLEGGVA